MRLLAGLLFFLTLTLVSTANAAVHRITRQTFEASPMCARFKCRLVSASTTTGLYQYRIFDEHNEAVRIYIASNAAARNSFVIYGNPGSLRHAPSVTVMEFFLQTTRFYTGIHLDAREDVLGTLDLISPDHVSFFDLQSGTIGGVPVKIYEKSLPDDSRRPEQASVAYGIVDANRYPPQR